MPQGNENTENKTFTGQDQLDAEQRLAELRLMLKNTRVFLQLICVSEEASRLYLEEVEAKLTNDVRRLENTLTSSQEPELEK